MGGGVDPLERRQLPHLPFINAGLKRKVEGVQRLLKR